MRSSAAQHEPCGLLEKAWRSHPIFTGYQSNDDAVAFHDVTLVLQRVVQPGIRQSRAACLAW